MPNVDLFHLFRWSVGWVATVYATVITIQSLYGWFVYLTATDRYTALMRRYLLVQAVRLRFFRFGSDLLICLLLCVAFMLLWRAHTAVWSAGDAWHAAKVQYPRPKLRATTSPVATARQSWADWLATSEFAGNSAMLRRIPELPQRGYSGY